MKLRFKIILLYLGVFILALTLTGAIVTETSYNLTIENEITRLLNQEENQYNLAVRYIRSESRVLPNASFLERYCPEIAEILGNGGSSCHIYNTEGKLLFANGQKHWYQPGREFQTALKGERNYMLTWKDTRHYLLISDLFREDKEEVVVTLIKDITFLDNQKRSQVRTFLNTGIIGLLVAAAFAPIFSRLIAKPVERLAASADSIASGDYGSRVQVARRDEIGILAEKFNKMAEVVENKIRELHGENESRQRFINNLTHEFRTPLTSIIGYADFLKSIRYEEKTFIDSLDYISMEGRRMLKLMEKLTELILLKRNPVDKKEYSSSVLFQNIRSILHGKLADKKISLIVEGPELVIHIDHVLFTAVLANLLENAIRASSIGSEIILSTEVVRGNPAIHVTDQGIGIPPEELDKITEPFYRVDKSRSRRDGGMGLGLAICREIVSLHGAELIFQSEPGRGTTSSILFMDLTNPAGKDGDHVGVY